MIQPEGESIVSREAGVLDTEGFGIERENLSMAYEAFMQYSNPIASIVREITSNALDATVEAGNNEPVVVEMSESNPLDDERWISFKDNGTGLVPLPKHHPEGRKTDLTGKKIDQIKKEIKESGKPSMLVYKNFFSSTKRGTVNQLGYFGLGAKSPLGYTDMFEVITRYNGEEYHYIVRRGDKRPELTLLEYSETDKQNGTTVRVPIKSSSDWYDFVDAIRTQLAYFDNVVFKGGISERVDNDFEIYRGNHIIYRPDGPFEKMHICLGKVYYPLDFKVMDIREGYHNSYNSKKRTGHYTPIGLYFSLEDQKDIPLKVIWNRENIEYNDKTKESINRKLELAKKEIQSLFDNQCKNIVTVGDWFEMKRMAADHVLKIDENIDIPLSTAISVEKDIEIPKYNKYFEKSPGDPFYMLKFHRAVEDGYIDQSASKMKISKLYHNPDKYPPIYLTREGFSTKKNKYICSKINPDDEDDIIILKVRNAPTNIEDDDIRHRIIKRYNAYYRNRTKGSKDPSEKELKAMISFEKQCIQHFFKKFNNYDRVTVPSSFNARSITKEETKTQTSYDPDEKFPLKVARTSSWTEETGWNRVRWKYEYLEKLDRRGTLVLYGFREDDDNLKKAIDLFDEISNFKIGSKKVRIVKIAKSRESMFESLKGSYYIDDFWESDHPIFSRVVTAFEIRDELPHQGNTRSWNVFLPEASEMYQEIKTLVSSYSFARGVSSWVDTFIDENKHLIDQDIIYKVETLRGYVIKYPILSWLSRRKPAMRSSSIDLEGEIKQYIEDKGEIHPHLLYRYTNKKNQSKS